MERPILILQKNAETTTNKIRLPKETVEHFGNQFYTDVFFTLILNQS